MNYIPQIFKNEYVNHNSFGKTYGEHKHILEFTNEQFFELKSHADNIKLLLLKY